MTRLPVSLLVLTSFSTAVTAAPALPSLLVASNYFFTIHSNATSAIWIAPPTWRVMRDTVAPTVHGTAIELHAARNEYEPVQIVTRTTEAGTRSLDLGASWTGPSGNVISATLHDVSYGATACATGDPDRLNPIAFGSPQTVCVNSNQVFWLTVFVPTNALPGIYSNTLTCVLSGVTTNIPIQVHVFNFTLPAETAFGSFISWSFTGTPSTDLEMKRWLHQHRLTPQNVTYPSAMRYDITWSTPANPNQCNAFYDEGDQPPAFGIRWLANQFVAGMGFNDGVGFPNFIALQFLFPSQLRPSTFCGESLAGDPRGMHYGTDDYNEAWGNYLAALQNYCDPNVPENAGGNPFGHDYLSKAVYWVINEPQNSADYDLAAWLAQVSRQYAPKLRLMISEEAKPEIFNNALYPDQGYDIWVGYLPTYATSVGNSLIRQRNHGEQSWWYMLPNTPPNFINPNTTNRPAIETRILTWLAWNQRVEGWMNSPVEPPLATFLGGTSFAPTIRSELLREAIEDYEYLKLTNGGRKPMAFQPNVVDPFVSLIASSLTGYDRDPVKLHWLRVQLGRKISGETVTGPLLPMIAARPFGSYYLNFQGNNPPPEPVFVDGKVWEPYGWQIFDSLTNASGWIVPDTNQLINAYNASSTSNVLQKTYIYDDYARQTTFMFGLANGVYDVEVGMGRPTAVSQALVTVNGIDVFGDRLANAPEVVPFNVAKTQRVAVANGWLIMEVGQPVNGDYNFVDFLGITGVSPSSPDGLDDLWQTAHFGSATNVLAAPDADPDNDGASNFFEFHAGTNPTSAASQPFITATLPNANQLQLQWSSATNHVFRIEQSSDLTNWSSAVDSVLATNSITSVAIPRNPADLQSFYRVIPIAP